MHAAIPDDTDQPRRSYLVPAYQRHRARTECLSRYVCGASKQGIVTHLLCMREFCNLHPGEVVARNQCCAVRICSALFCTQAQLEHLPSSYQPNFACRCVQWNCSFPPRLILGYTSYGSAGRYKLAMRSIDPRERMPHPHDW